MHPNSMAARVERARRKGRQAAHRGDPETSNPCKFTEYGTGHQWLSAYRGALEAIENEEHRQVQEDEVNR